MVLLNMQVPLTWINLHNNVYMSWLTSIVCVCVCQDSASLCSQRGGIMKQGWLQKANINSSLSVSMRVSHRSTYCLLFMQRNSYKWNSRNEGFTTELRRRGNSFFLGHFCFVVSQHTVYCQTFYIIVYSYTHMNITCTTALVNSNKMLYEVE